MFGWFSRKPHSPGAANLAALFNNASGPGGIENFANMLNNMGAGGGAKLGTMFNHLNARGTSNYTAFLNSADTTESAALSEWIERASEGEILGLCHFLNNPPSSDAAALKNAIVKYANLRTAQLRPPSYDAVRTAVVEGRHADVLKYLRDGFKVQTRNEHDEVLLLHAVCLGDARLTMTQLLVGLGADVNAAVRGKTLLELIRDPTFCDNERTVAYLLEHGARETAPPVIEPQPVMLKQEPCDEAEMIRFNCPQCGKRHKVEIRGAGRRATCSKCGTKIIVPGATILHATAVNVPVEEPATLSMPLTGREAAKRFNDMGNIEDPRLAEQNLKAAIEADSYWAIPYCNLAKLYFGQGRQQQARECFQRAYQLASVRRNPGDDLVCQESELHLRMLGFRSF